MAVVIGTRLGTPERSLVSSQLGEGAPIALSIEEEGVHSRIFRGAAFPNPTFLYDSRRVLEGIICLEDEPHVPQYRHGLALKTLMEKISDIAANTGHSPILSMQCPAQLPPHSFADDDITSRQEDWPRSSSLAVRFSIALRESVSGERSDLMSKLAEYCEPLGLGLWFTDTRFGHRAGNWFKILGHDRVVARRNFPRTADRNGASEANCVLPVTFVGPARVGSTHAIVRYLSSLSKLGILSCSVTALDEIAFVHVQLVVNYAKISRLEAINRGISFRVRNANEGAGANVGSPGTVLPALLTALVPDETLVVEKSVLANLTVKAGDYQTLVGPAARVAPSGRRLLPIWFSWSVKGSDVSLAVALRTLARALQLVGIDTPSGVEGSTGSVGNIEYMICRKIGSSVLKAKGKLGIPEESLAIDASGAGNGSAPGKLCARLEDVWRTEFEGQAGESMAQLAVASREYRVGQPGSLD